MIDEARPSQNLRWAVQSNVVLMKDYQADTDNANQPVTGSANTALVTFENGDMGLVLLFGPPEVPLSASSFHFSHLLAAYNQVESAIKIQHALKLDGGPSSQLMFQYDGEKPIRAQHAPQGAQALTNFFVVH